MTLRNITVVWEYVGGDAHVSTVQTEAALYGINEQDVLKALGEDETSDIRIIALFGGYHQTLYGSAIPIEGPTD